MTPEFELERVSSLQHVVRFAYDEAQPDLARLMLNPSRIAMQTRHYSETGGT
jgi:hypothetical protein